MDFARFLVLTRHWSEGQLGVMGGISTLRGTLTGWGPSQDALGGTIPWGPSSDGKAESSLLHWSCNLILNLGGFKNKGTFIREAWTIICMDWVNNSWLIITTTTTYTHQGWSLLSASLLQKRFMWSSHKRCHRSCCGLRGVLLVLSLESTFLLVGLLSFRASEGSEGPYWRNSMNFHL